MRTSRRARTVPACIDCQAIGSGSHKEACDPNSDSDALRNEVLVQCGLADEMIEGNWWQDNEHSIHFNYTGEAGFAQGATIDVETREVVLYE